MNHRFSEPVTVFHDRRLPEPARPAGYAWLVDVHDLEVPLPHRLHAIGQCHRIVSTTDWRILTPRHAPDDTLAGHLTFALKWEGVDLLVLKRLFLAVPEAEIEVLVADQPTGACARRIWFLFEWLTGRRLALRDARRGSYVNAIDPKIQFAVPGERSPRHRVRNNLPGTPDFCPLVFRTEALEALIAKDLSGRARAACDRVPGEILSRTAAFLLLGDSRSRSATGESFSPTAPCSTRSPMSARPRSSRTSVSLPSSRGSAKISGSGTNSAWPAIACRSERRSGSGKAQEGADSL